MDQREDKAAPRPDRILVVDDDREIADLLVHLLEREGFELQVAYSGAAALALFAAEPIDLVILDVMMPGLDGWGVCGKIRETSAVPVVFLSAKDEEFDQVMGLTLGADDYISKPFRSRELIARVKAHLRRSKLGVLPMQASVLRADGVEVNVATHEAFANEMPLGLTPKEFDILVSLLRANGEPVSASELFEGIWGEAYDMSAGNTVMVHIRRLRRKLADCGVGEALIETVWGVGYRVRPHVRG